MNIQSSRVNCLCLTFTIPETSAFLGMGPLKTCDTPNNADTPSRSVEYADLFVEPPRLNHCGPLTDAVGPRALPMNCLSVLPIPNTAISGKAGKSYRGQKIWKSFENRSWVRNHTYWKIQLKELTYHVVLARRLNSTELS